MALNEGLEIPNESFQTREKKNYKFRNFNNALKCPVGMTENFYFQQIYFQWIFLLCRSVNCKRRECREYKRKQLKLPRIEMDGSNEIVEAVAYFSSAILLNLVLERCAYYICSISATKGIVAIAIEAMQNMGRFFVAAERI